jgi:crossover junction endodeoxyribonuclease RuvC
LHKKQIILGIDPGTIVMGYGLITIENGKATLLDLGVIKPGALKDPYKKLQLIFNTVSSLITKYHATDFAIEAPFFGKNVQSMLKLGRAQGVAIAAAIRHGLEVTEYAPKKVKQAVTGNGNADKLRVLQMLQTILQFKNTQVKLDATDALAVAYCHYLQTGKPALLAAKNNLPVVKKSSTKNSSWENFIKSNPNRVTK